MYRSSYIDPGKRFRILNELGTGGFARVYLCRDRITREVRAVKVANSTHDRSPLREAQQLRYLAHPNIVKVYDVGEDQDGRLFLVMDFVEGPTLADFLEVHSSVPAAVARRLALDLAEGLAAIHQSGIVHRDLTPANLILDPVTHRLIICDFGIARELGLSTTTGTLVGTMRYMPPEQMRGRVSPRTDVFSLGVVLYEMLTGDLPWGEGQTALIAYRIMRFDRARLRREMRGVPTEFRSLLLRALERDPRRRFASIPAMRGALERLKIPARGRSLGQLVDRYYDVRRVCATCGSDLITHMRYCPQCADRKRFVWNDRLPGRCPRCSWERAPHWRFCAWCGTTFSRPRPGGRDRTRQAGACPACRRTVPLYCRFCPHCREGLVWDAEFKIPCPGCAWGVSERWTGCPWCGRRLKRVSRRR